MVELKKDDPEDACDRTKPEFSQPPMAVTRISGLYINIDRGKFTCTWLIFRPPPRCTAEDTPNSAPLIRSSPLFAGAVGPMLQNYQL